MKRKLLDMYDANLDYINQEIIKVLRELGEL